MSDLTGFERFVKEDLWHLGIGLGIEGLSLLLAFTGLPLFVAGAIGVPLATGIGYARERIQMKKQQDPGFGVSRRRDMLGFTIGAGVGYLGVLAGILL